MDDPPLNAIHSESRAPSDDGSSAPPPPRSAPKIDVAAAAWLFQAADLEGSRRLLESALAAAPHDVRARALLAQVLFRQRDFVGASELFERLLGEFPGDAPLLFNLALCHLKGGRPGPAAATFRQILERRPDHTRARAWLRVAEAATPAPPQVTTVSEPPPDAPSLEGDAAPESRTYRPRTTRPSRLEEVPRVSLPPGALVAKDDSGVVSLRVDEATGWVVRRSTLEGYSGLVAQSPAAHGAGFVVLSGEGTALLTAPGSLVVLELLGEEAGARASALAGYAMGLAAEVADPEVVGDLGEPIFRLEGTGPVILETRAELTALPVSLTHATTVRWDHVVGWTGHVIGAPTSQVDADGRTLARFAGRGSLLLAIHDAAGAGALASYGRCEVIRRLGGGPRDEILLARSAGPGGFRRKVVLERRLVGGDEARPIERLAREAHAYALLTHLAIARLFDFLLLDGHPVIVREYVSGVSLAELVAAVDRDDEARAAIALYVAHGVLSGLAAAHEACEPDTGDVVPLVHGGVRAGCVLVGWNGDVKVTGFAAARLEAGRPPTMKSDVRAAARLLVDMLGARGAFDPASDGASAAPPAEVDLRDALARAPLGPVRADRRGPLRDALLAALSARAGTPPARELAGAIAEAVDLDLARALCLDVLGGLRERQGGAALSSLPPPVVAAREDSGSVYGAAIPKPSPVPMDPDAERAGAPSADPSTEPASAEPPRAEPAFAVPLRTEPPPAGRESYATPLPVQPPSLEPAPPASVLSGPGARWRLVATAIAASVVAVASGVASIAVPGSARETTAAPAAAAAPASRARGPSVDVPAPAPSAATEAPPAAPAVPPDGGLLRAPARARQHRIFLDGRVIGEGPGEYAVPCGAHDVRVGSQGDDARIDVPCGGAVDLE